MNQVFLFIGQEKKLHLAWPTVYFYFFPLKLTFKTMISPGQSYAFDTEHVDIFVVFLDFYQSTESRNRCFNSLGREWWCSVLDFGQRCPVGSAMLPHRRHRHFSPYFSPHFSLHKHSKFLFVFPDELGVFISSNILLCKSGKGFYAKRVLMTYERLELDKGLQPEGATLYSRT